MWWLLVGAWALLNGGLLLATSRQAAQRGRERQQAFRDTVELCGLSVVSISKPGAISMKLKADAGPVKVRIEDILNNKKDHRLLVEATFPEPPGFSGVRIRPETYKPAGAREFEAGDGRFDGTFYVEGPARLLTQLLDAETRRLLVQANAGGQLAIAGGEIRVETLDIHLASVLSSLVDLTRRFTQEVDVAQRLAENARQDSVAGVRLRNLLVLIREFPGEPVTLETLRAACSDVSPQVRLRAAMALGAEGRDVLAEMAESLENDDISAQAVAHLGRELPFERMSPLLAQALRRRRLRTARACLEALGSSGAAEAVDVLAKVLAVEQGELAPVAALALGATGSPAAEPALLQALQRENMDIQIAAASGLGRAGSAASVLPLKQAAESSRDRELRRATRQAIAEIQSRLQAASPGQLSLAGDEAGQLSLPEAETGQLSLPPAGPD